MYAPDDFHWPPLYRRTYCLDDSSIHDHALLIYVQHMDARLLIAFGLSFAVGMAVRLQSQRAEKPA